MGIISGKLCSVKETFYSQKIKIKISFTTIKFSCFIKFGSSIINTYSDGFRFILISYFYSELTESEPHVSPEVMKKFVSGTKWFFSRCIKPTQISKNRVTKIFKYLSQNASWPQNHPRLSNVFQRSQNGSLVYINL